MQVKLLVGDKGLAFDTENVGDLHEASLFMKELMKSGMYELAECLGYKEGDCMIEVKITVYQRQDTSEWMEIE